jgi:hypothetical protein
MVTALQASPATLNLTGLPTAEGADVLLIEIGMAWQHHGGRGAVPTTARKWLMADSREGGASLRSWFAAAQVVVKPALIRPLARAVAAARDLPWRPRIQLPTVHQPRAISIISKGTTGVM